MISTRVCTSIYFSFSIYTVIGCQELPPLVNGEIFYFNINDTEQLFELGTVALHECKEGFSIVGPEMRTCLMDSTNSTVGTFSESAPTCEGKKISICVFFVLKLTSFFYTPLGSDRYKLQ